ncbi:MAG: hypothetical protein MN733_01870, partial [Nitrososphaera sp.]|nr:hypothetical protein [Nitrososphaera sp.]
MSTACVDILMLFVNNEPFYVTYVMGGAMHFMKMKDMTEYARMKGAPMPQMSTVGTGIKTAQAMAHYYEKEVLEIKGATHPGILIGEHA